MIGPHTKYTLRSKDKTNRLCTSIHACPKRKYNVHASTAGFKVTNGNLEFAEGLRTKGVPQDHVLKLKKNMYGLKQGGHSWYMKLSEGLLAHDFTYSKVDKCLFMRKDCSLEVHVDDCLLFSRNDSTLDDVINSL